MKMELPVAKELFTKVESPGNKGSVRVMQNGVRRPYKYSLSMS